MQPDSAAHIWDARGAAKRALEAVEGVSWNEYAIDWLRQSAVERQIEIIGEALARLRRSDDATASRIPDLRLIIGTRNVIAHGYDIVDQEVIWSLVHVGVPDLLRVLKSLLDELPPPE